MTVLPSKFTPISKERPQAMANANYDKLSLLIDGEWLSGGGRIEQKVVNPATNETIGMLPHASTADLDRALDAAKRGFEVWRNTSPYERAKVLRKVASLLRERVEKIATQLTMDQGKPIAESRAEVLSSADHFDWNADEGRRSYGRIIPSRSKGQRQIVLREPVGPVAAFTPWNFPINLPSRKISTALAAGCSCIIKPAEETPGASIALARAVMDAGVPPGVLNMVFGVPAEISSYLIASPIIKKITFTGSTAVGKLLGKLAAEGVKRTTMELGGHAPVVVFDDVDADKVAELSVANKFRNAGQVCVSPTRFYVHERIHEKFVDRFAALAKQMKVGNGLAADSKMGPCANPRRVEAMDSFIADAQKRGARLMAGGQRLGNEGFFWQPTVLADVPNDATIMNTEPFGPVAVINRFRDFDEVVEQANRLPYGLASYTFTESERTATAIGDALDSGMVGINTFAITAAETPFGGVKESGYGSEGGIEGLDGYLTTKFISQF
jgi:succinate-semialdehyde dehydrogenase / glutarate-semialdehyde dehydrogenase